MKFMILQFLQKEFSQYEPKFGRKTSKRSIGVRLQVMTDKKAKE